MAKLLKTELAIHHRFDPRSCRHALNGVVTVLHCHHYSSLYTQLADDCTLVDAKRILRETAEDAFYKVLTSYFAENECGILSDRVAIAEQYYAYVGLGAMQFLCAGHDSGEVILTHSHVDEGWLKKFGRSDRPLNFITCGYLAACFAAMFDRPTRSYSVEETESIVRGAERSRFQIVIR